MLIMLLVNKQNNICIMKSTNVQINVHKNVQINDYEKLTKFEKQILDVKNKVKFIFNF